jgi:hypothetical protein
MMARSGVPTGTGPVAVNVPVVCVAGVTTALLPGVTILIAVNCTIEFFRFPGYSMSLTANVKQLGFGLFLDHLMDFRQEADRLIEQFTL